MALMDGLGRSEPRIGGWSVPARPLTFRSLVSRSRAGQEPENMSKKTQKRKANARRKKANHGRKPNAGRD
jgi:hypothetical protein